MKHALSFTPTSSPDHLALDYACTLEPSDLRLFQPHKAIRIALDSVHWTDLPITFCLDTGSKPLETPRQALGGLAFEFYPKLPMDPLSLDKVWPERVFHVSLLRAAYVIARRIMHAVEDAVILQVPMTPFFGVVQTFDVRVDVPKSITHFDAYRRSILVHPKR